MQNIKLQDIKSILESLKPKDLVNLSNLDAALAKIQEMLKLLSQANAQSTTKIPSSASLGSGIPTGDFIPAIPISVGTSASIDALIEASEAIQARANAFAELLDQQSVADELALNEYIKKLGLVSSASSVDLSSTVPVATAAAIQSGNRYAAQAAAQYNVTINAGVGSDPNAIAEAIDEVLRQARDRGTLTAA